MKLGALDYLFKPLMEGPDIEKVIMEAKEQLGFSSRSSEAAEHQNAVRTKLKEIIENGVSANISPLLELIPQLSSSHYFTMALMVQDEHIDTEKAYVLLDSSQALIAGFSLPAPVFLPAAVKFCTHSFIPITATENLFPLIF